MSKIKRTFGFTAVLLCCVAGIERNANAVTHVHEGDLCAAGQGVRERRQAIRGEQGVMRKECEPQGSIERRAQTAPARIEQERHEPTPAGDEYHGGRRTVERGALPRNP